MAREQISSIEEKGLRPQRNAETYLVPFLPSFVCSQFFDVPKTVTFLAGFSDHNRYGRFRNFVPQNFDPFAQGSVTVS